MHFGVYYAATLKMQMTWGIKCRYIIFKDTIQKSKLFNLADMFGYKTMPDTEKIAADLNGRSWEEF